MKLVMLGNDTKEEIEKRLQIVSAAGNLSRAEGTVTQVFESRNDYESNLKLATRHALNNIVNNKSNVQFIITRISLNDVFKEFG